MVRGAVPRVLCGLAEAGRDFSSSSGKEISRRSKSARVAAVYSVENHAHRVVQGIFPVLFVLAVRERDSGQ